MKLANKKFPIKRKGNDIPKKNKICFFDLKPGSLFLLTAETSQLYIELLYGLKNQKTNENYFDIEVKRKNRCVKIILFKLRDDLYLSGKDVYNLKFKDVCYNILNFHNSYVTVL